jgi:hypothetical protein
MVRRPVEAPGINTCQDDCIFGWDALIGISRYPGTFSDGST